MRSRKTAVVRHREAHQTHADLRLAAQWHADEPRPDLETETAVRRRAQDATGRWRTASVRNAGSIGLLQGERLVAVELRLRGKGCSDRVLQLLAGGRGSAGFPLDGMEMIRIEVGRLAVED